jgi:hypothetical protein
MQDQQRLADLEREVAELRRQQPRRGLWRTRWAAIGAAVAVTVGAGTALRMAVAAPGDTTPTSFFPLPPTRILDTRPAPLNVGGFIGPLGQQSTRTIQVAGVAGVPLNASAVVMNVTVDRTSLSSFLTVYPAGGQRPVVSNLNWKAAGTTIPNLVTVKLGTNGQVSIYNNTGSTDVIADVAGYYAPANDKFISLDIFPNIGSAGFGVGYGPFSGLTFADGAAQADDFHFVLPPDYTSGGAIVATMTWHTVATSCSVYWRANYASVSRPGQVHITGDTATSGMTDPTPNTAGTTANLVQSASFTLTSPNDTVALQPGDSYTFGLYRDGASGLDTCTATALMDSMVIRYE